jgi:hypothetical protein
MYRLSATGGMVFEGHTPGGGIRVMGAKAIPCRIHQRSRSLAVMLVKEVRELLPWRAGDFVAARVCGEKLVLERISLESMATIRTGELQARAAESLDG